MALGTPADASNAYRSALELPPNRRLAGGRVLDLIDAAQATAETVCANTAATIAHPSKRCEPSGVLQRPRSMISRRILGALALALAAAGCGQDSPENGAGTARSTVVDDFSGGVDGPVMFVSGPPTEGGDGAAIEGTLTRDGDCLFVGDEVPGSRFAVLWPFGTSWDDQSDEVVLLDGTRIPIGATLFAGGGFPSADDVGRFADDIDLIERAEACAEGEYRELAHVQHSISAK